MNDEKKGENENQDEFEVEEINSEIEEISSENSSEKEKEGGMNLNEKEKNKKMKNLMSLTILLAGLFLGSLFVDLSQVIKGRGYSTKKLNEAEIFESDGKTWVAFEEPAVGVNVISDDSCEKCDPSEVLVWLRRVLPTVSANKVSYDSEEGKKMIDKFKIKTLPAFVFDRFTYLILGESLVVLIEALIYWKLLKLKPFDSFIVSLLANVVSIVLGFLLQIHQSHLVAFGLE